MRATRLALSLLAAGALCACGSKNINAEAMAAAKRSSQQSTAKRIATSYAGPKIRVAVGQFTVLEAAQALFDELGWGGLGPLISQQVLTGLVQTNRVAVLERQQLDKVVGNLNTGTQGDMAQYFDQETTAEAGKLLGAQAVLVGSSTFGSTPIGEATRMAAREALEGLVGQLRDTPWEGDIASVDQSGKVYIQAGADLNLQKGDVFEALRRGEPITDPDGDVLGYQEERLGKVEVQAVLPKLSVAAVVEGEAPAAGDRVRLAQ